MHLSPREQEKLLIVVAAQVARERRDRGLRLNYPEAVALITAALVEGARDGRSMLLDPAPATGLPLSCMRCLPSEASTVAPTSGIETPWSCAHSGRARIISPASCARRRRSAGGVSRVASKAGRYYDSPRRTRSRQWRHVGDVRRLQGGSRGDPDGKQMIAWRVAGSVLVEYDPMIHSRAGEGSPQAAALAAQLYDSL